MKNIIASIAFAIALVCSVPSLHAQQGKSETLECIGGLSGVMLYNTYGFIGAIGDGYEDKVYEGDYTKELMAEQIGMIGAVREQVEGMLNSGFLEDPSDKEYVRQILETFDYLEKMAESLQEYVDGASSDDFQDAREKAWANIADMLGIEED